MSSVDLAVAYRVYPGIGRPPPIYGDDKLALARFCWRSFLTALGPLRVKVWVLLDACPDAFRAVFDEDAGDSIHVEIETIDLDGEGNAATFGRQIRVLTEQAQAECVYFAEDDYFYYPRALAEAMDAFRRSDGPDYLTLLDHGDYEASPVHDYRWRDREIQGRRWRSVASTCLTFLTRRAVLEQDQAILRAYTRNCSDVGVWFSLTRQPLRSLRIYRHALRGCRHAWLALGHAWRFGGLRMCSGPERSLWAPRPTLAMHLEASSLSRDRDWSAELKTHAARLMG